MVNLTSHLKNGIFEIVDTDGSEKSVPTQIIYTNIRGAYRAEPSDAVSLQASKLDSKEAALIQAKCDEIAQATYELQELLGLSRSNQELGK